MALIKDLNGVSPKIELSCFLADNCVVIGDVVIGNNSSIWFSVVIRGDVNSIIIGDNCNIQDGVVIHSSYKKFKTTLGNNVSVGHNAIVHACEIHDNVLIGMGSIVMDGCIVNKNSVIAAGAVVAKNTIIESGSVYAGVPAKKIKQFPKTHFEDSNKQLAEQYKVYSDWY